MRTAIYFFYGLDAEIRPKSGVPHHPPELFIHLGGAIGKNARSEIGAVSERYAISSRVSSTVFVMLASWKRCFGQTAYDVSTQQVGKQQELPIAPPRWINSSGGWCGTPDFGRISTTSP